MRLYKLTIGFTADACQHEATEWLLAGPGGSVIAAVNIRHLGAKSDPGSFVVATANPDSSLVQRLCPALPITSC